MKTLEELNAEQAELMATVQAQLAAGIPFELCAKARLEFMAEWNAAKNADDRRYSRACRAVDQGR